MPATLTLLAGGGHLPAKVAAGALAKGYAVQAVVFKGQPQPVGLPEGVAVRVFPLGAVGKIVAHLQATGTTHVCLAGGLSKPSLLGLQPDALGLKIMLKAGRFTDDALLRAVAAELAVLGFSVVAPHDLAPGLVIAAGSYGLKLPKALAADAALGFATLKALGPLDLGQACVVHAGAVLGIEAVEGTDALIMRCAGYVDTLGGAAKPPAGLLVKAAKPGQTALADLPFIGQTTLKLLHQHGYVGVVVRAGTTLTDDVDALAATATTLGLVCDAAP